MDPFVVYLTVIIGGLGSYAAYITKRYLTHLESDLAYSRRTAIRGTVTAEEATKTRRRSSSGTDVDTTPDVA